MKARLAINATCPNPRFDFQEYSKALKAGERYPEPTTLHLKKGTIIDEHDCWKLVIFGLAYPEDAECRAAAEFKIGHVLTDEEFQRRMEIQLKTRAGMLSNKPEQNARPTETLDDDVSPEAANA